MKNIKEITTQYCVVTDVVRQCKKTADPQKAHLVFADTQPNAEKPKEPFLPTHGQTDRQKKVNLTTYKILDI